MGIDSAKSAGLLGDSTSRDYSRKLALFNAFAAAELRQAVAELGLRPGMHVLDAGCGTGEALAWLKDAVGASGFVAGLEMAAAHVAVSRRGARPGVGLVQGDLTKQCFLARSFDLVWSVNTLNHTRDPVGGIKSLAALLHPGGRIAVGQSSLLQDMYFAWDSRLERVTNEAVRRYYRERYGLSERDLTAVRSVTGWLKRAALKDVRPRTLVIERTPPLSDADEAYLREAIFLGTWGERLRPYLAREDYEELARLCDPASPDYALRRTEFHFLQTFTLVVGEVP